MQCRTLIYEARKKIRIELTAFSEEKLLGLLEGAIPFGSSNVHSDIVKPRALSLLRHLISRLERVSAVSTPAVFLRTSAAQGLTNGWGRQRILSSLRTLSNWFDRASV